MRYVTRDDYGVEVCLAGPPGPQGPAGPVGPPGPSSDDLQGQITALEGRIAVLEGVPRVQPPEVYATASPFTLNSTPVFLIEVMVLSDTTFHYLQEGDYTLDGPVLYVPGLTDGDRVKVVYAA